MSTQIGFPYHLDILCFMGLFWELSCQQYLVLVWFIFCGFTFLKVFSLFRFIISQQTMKHGEPGVGLQTWATANIQNPNCNLCVHLDWKLYVWTITQQ